MIALYTDTLSLILSLADQLNCSHSLGFFSGHCPKFFPNVRKFSGYFGQDVQKYFILFFIENFRFTLCLLNLDKNSTYDVVNYKLKLRKLCVH